jgi:hypothetical protein
MNLESERESAVKVHEKYILFEVRLVLLRVLLGLIGFSLGILSDDVASIGFAMLVSAMLIYSILPIGDVDLKWLAALRRNADILIIFGGMASIGFAFRILAEISF